MRHLASNEVRKARPEQAATLARTLARAFHADPVITWLVPDSSRRLVASERAFALFARRIWLPHDETYVVGDAAGVCVWVPPGAWRPSIGERLALLPGLARISGRLLLRMLRAQAALEKDHPSDPHYYLPFMGVEPERQGRGMGSALMHPVLRRCDAEGIPAYLEASSPHNKALYERHGFEVTEEFGLGGGSPPLWQMWRAPGS